MTVRRSRASLALIVLVLGPLCSSGSASALEKEALSVSRSDPVDERDYSPIPTSAGGLFIDPESCNTDATCDTIPVHLDARAFDEPKKIFLQVNFLLSWEAEDADGTAVPDLDLYVYADPKGKEEVGDGASSAQPERAGFDYKKRDQHTFYAVVVNFAGGPTGYHLRVEAQGLEIKDVPKFERPTSVPPPPPPTLKPLATGEAPAATSSPRETLTPVITPGPDGPLTDLDLEAVDASAAGAKGGAPWWVILVSAVGSVGVLGGTGFLLFRRVRPRRA